jgi:dihydrofolate synthase / folylpolyglutamate synthase
MSYAAAVDHLYALGHELVPAAPDAPRRKFELEHMRTLALALGNPQSSFASVLIAGTNGKGSTAATLASILQSAGYRTALYTSPHLERINERIRINGEPIADDDFARLYFQVDDTAQRLVREGRLPHHPSFFETLTAIAFLHFAGGAPQPALSLPKGLDSETWVSQDASTNPVDIAILEVGMGGRLDATNIVEPLVSVITDIALDHQDYLGRTIAEIAREKAGILRPNGILVTLPQHPEANQAIGEAAIALPGLHAINAAAYVPHTPIRQDSRHSEWSEAASRNPRISLEAPPISLVDPRLLRNRYSLTLAGEPLEVDSPLFGQHQQRNIALAIAAADQLRNIHRYIISASSNRQGYKITNRQIEQGICDTHWPGRLELLRPAEGPPILLDVAHNPAGAWTLRAAVAQLPASQPRTLIFSCLRDKDLREMMQILLPLFDSSSDRTQDHVLFAPIHNPRAASLDDLVAAARSLDVPALTAPTVTEALAEARRLTPPGGIIIATGSIYLVGELRSIVTGE